MDLIIRRKIKLPDFTPLTCLMLYIRPQYIIDLPYSSYVYFALSGLGVLYLLFKVRVIKIKVRFVVFSTIISVFLFSSLINGVLIPSMILDSLTWIFLFLSLMLISMHYNKAIIKYAFYISLFFVIINLISLVIFPQGISIGYRGERINFISIDNELPNFMIPFIFYSFMSNKYFPNKFMLFFSQLLVIFTTILAPTTTAIITYLYIYLNIAVFSLTRKKRLLVIMQFATLLFLFWFFTIGQYQYIFANFIENILQKDITFTNRTLIWKTAIDVIRNANIKNFIFGFGNQYILLIITGNSYFSHAHSEFFEYFLNYGVVGFLSLILLFLYLMLYCGKRMLIQTKSYYYPTVLGLLLIGIVETAYDLNFILFVSIIVFILIKERDYSRKPQ